MKSDTQLKQAYKLYVDPDEDITILVFFWNEDVKEDNIRVAELVEQDVTKLITEDPTPRNVLVDLSLFGDIPVHVPKRTLEILAGLLKLKETRKVALLGASNFLKQLANFTIKLSGKKDVRWFTDARKAKDWFKE